ncbi:MAG: hypothetical protein IKU37_01865 [Candidatus Gastranaerophilales bacterium]|nr:hypothetical protein [Candidatus Gastranaerophilales bacterium]
MSVNRASNNIFIKPYEQYKLKTYAQNNADNPIFSTQSQVDTFQRTTQNYQENEIIDTTSLKQDLEKTKSEQGILGKLWDGFKNLTGIGASSSKAEQAIEDYENGLISIKEMEHAVSGYQEGQKMAVDVVADMASGMLSIVVFGAATAVLGPVGALFAAGVTGAISKVGIKAGDALVAGKEYTSKDLLYDTTSGGINGLLGPVTNGIGNTVTKTIASKIIKEGAEEVVEQGVKQGFKQFAKNVILNQSDDIIGGTLKQRAIAFGAGMATDGALGGTADNMVRASLEGEDVLKAGVQGFVGGLIMAPIIGGGMKLAGKAGNELGTKIFNKASSNETVDTIAKNTEIEMGADLASNESVLSAEYLMQEDKAVPTNISSRIFDNSISICEDENYITKIVYTNKLGEQVEINGLNIRKAYNFNENDLATFVDFIEDGVSEQNATFATRKIARNQFETQVEKEAFVKCIKNGISSQKSMDLAMYSSEVWTKEQNEIFNICLEKKMAEIDIDYAVCKNLTLEQCDFLVKARNELCDYSDIPKRILESYGSEQCDIYYSLVKNGVRKETAFAKIESGDYSKEQLAVFKNLIAQNVDSDLAFNSSIQGFSIQQTKVLSSLIQQGMSPDIACIAAKNNFSKEVIDTLLKETDFQFELIKLQNDAGYKISGTKKYGNIVECTEITDSGKIKRYQTEEIASDIFREQVVGSSRIIEIKRYGQDAYQLEIVNDNSGKPSYVLYRKPLEELKGGYSVIKYNYSDYPENFDLISAIKNNEVTGETLAGIKTNNNGQVEYFENFLHENNKIQRRYIQTVDNNKKVLSTNYQYNIVDENGCVILNLDRSWFTNSDGSTTTIINGKKYTSSFDDATQTITIEDQNGEVSKFSLKGKTKIGWEEFVKIYGSEEEVEKSFFELCKNMPADMLMEIDKIKNIEFVGCLSASAHAGLEILCVPPKNSYNNLATTAHEVGHLKDGFLHGISDNQDLQKIYNQEMGYFEANYPKTMQEIISYFNQQGGSGHTGLSEVVAETNLLLTSYGHDDYLADRANFLAKYFPKTIAKIAEFLGYTS